MREYDFKRRFVCFKLSYWAFSNAPKEYSIGYGKAGYQIQRYYIKERAIAIITEVSK